MNNTPKIILCLSLLVIVSLGYGQNSIELSQNESPLSFANNEAQSLKRFSVYGGALTFVEYLNPRFNIQLQYAIKPWMAIEYDRRFGVGGHANYGRIGLNFNLNPASEKKLKYYVGVLGAMTRHFYFDIPIGISYPLGEKMNVKLGVRFFYLPDDYEPAGSILAELMFGMKL
jgi:hypothetical protein